MFKDSWCVSVIPRKSDFWSSWPTASAERPPCSQVVQNVGGTWTNPVFQIQYSCVLFFFGVIIKSYRQYCAASTCTRVVILLPHANYHVVRLWASNANDNNRQMDLPSPTYTFNSNVTSQCDVSPAAALRRFTCRRLCSSYSDVRPRLLHQNVGLEPQSSSVFRCCWKEGI